MEKNNSQLQKEIGGLHIEFIDTDDEEDEDNETTKWNGTKVATTDIIYPFALNLFGSGTMECICEWCVQSAPLLGFLDCQNEIDIAHITSTLISMNQCHDMSFIGRVVLTSEEIEKHIQELLKLATKAVTKANAMISQGTNTSFHEITTMCDLITTRVCFILEKICLSYGSVNAIYDILEKLQIYMHARMLNGPPLKFHSQSIIYNIRLTIYLYSQKKSDIDEEDRQTWSADALIDDFRGFIDAEIILRNGQKKSARECAEQCSMLITKRFVELANVVLVRGSARTALAAINALHAALVIEEVCGGLGSTGSGIAAAILCIWICDRYGWGIGSESSGLRTSWNNVRMIPHTKDWNEFVMNHYKEENNDMVSYEISTNEVATVIMNACKVIEIACQLINDKRLCEIICQAVDRGLEAIADSCNEDASRMFRPLESEYDSDYERQTETRWYDDRIKIVSAICKVAQRVTEIYICCTDPKYEKKKTEILQNHLLSEWRTYIEKNSVPYWSEVRESITKTRQIDGISAWIIRSAFCWPEADIALSSIIKTHINDKMFTPAKSTSYEFISSNNICNGVHLSTMETADTYLKLAQPDQNIDSHGSVSLLRQLAINLAVCSAICASGQSKINGGNIMCPWLGVNGIHPGAILASAPETLPGGSNATRMLCRRPTHTNSIMSTTQILAEAAVKCAEFILNINDEEEEIFSAELAVGLLGGTNRTCRSWTQLCLIGPCTAYANLACSSGYEGLCALSYMRSIKKMTLTYCCEWIAREYGFASIACMAGLPQSIAESLAADCIATSDCPTPLNNYDTNTIEMERHNDYESDINDISDNESSDVLSRTLINVGAKAWNFFSRNLSNNTEQKHHDVESNTQQKERERKLRRLRRHVLKHTALAIGHFPPKCRWKSEKSDMRRRLWKCDQLIIECISKFFKTAPVKDILNVIIENTIIDITESYNFEHISLFAMGCISAFIERTDESNFTKLLSIIEKYNNIYSISERRAIRDIGIVTWIKTFLRYNTNDNLIPLRKSAIDFLDALLQLEKVDGRSIGFFSPGEAEWYLKNHTEITEYLCTCIKENNETIKYIINVCESIAQAGYYCNRIEMIEYAKTLIIKIDESVEKIIPGVNFCAKINLLGLHSEMCRNEWAYAISDECISIPHQYTEQIRKSKESFDFLMSVCQMIYDKRTTTGAMDAYMNHSNTIREVITLFCRTIGTIVEAISLINFFNSKNNDNDNEETTTFYSNLTETIKFIDTTLEKANEFWIDQKWLVDLAFSASLSICSMAFDPSSVPSIIKDMEISTRIRQVYKINSFIRRSIYSLVDKIFKNTATENCIEFTKVHETIKTWCLSN